MDSNKKVELNQAFLGGYCFSVFEIIAMTIVAAGTSSLIELSVGIEIKKDKWTSLCDNMLKSSNRIIQIVPCKSSLDFKTEYDSNKQYNTNRSV